MRKFRSHRWLRDPHRGYTGAPPGCHRQDTVNAGKTSEKPRRVEYCAPCPIRAASACLMQPWPDVVNICRAGGKRASLGKSEALLRSTRRFGKPQTPIERDTMAQAIMDPEQVRRFAEELKRFNTDLKDKIVSLQARFAALGDTWQDQEHVKFAEEFKQTMKALKKFVEISNQHTPYLMRKAQRIEEYLNQR